MLLGEGFARGALKGDASAGDGDDVVRGFLGESELVQRCDDADAARAGEPAQHLQHFQLRRDVEIRCRLVQNENAGLLADGACDQRALPLPVAKGCEIPFGNIFNMTERKRLLDRIAVGVREGAKAPGVGEAPRLHHITACEQFRRGTRGVMDGERAGEVAFA